MVTISGSNIRKRLDLVKSREVVRFSERRSWPFASYLWLRVHLVRFCIAFANCPTLSVYSLYLSPGGHGSWCRDPVPVMLRTIEH